MKRLEQHPRFDSRIKFEEIEPSSVEIESSNLDDLGLGEAGLNMFDESPLPVAVVRKSDLYFIIYVFVNC